MQYPSWIEEKDKEKYKIFHSVVKPKENFNNASWTDWYNTYESENKIPQNTSLTPFQVCLLTNACRGDRLTNTLTNFVQDTLKLNSLSGLEVNMKTIVE